MFGVFASALNVVECVHVLRQSSGGRSGESSSSSRQFQLILESPITQAVGVPQSSVFIGICDSSRSFRCEHHLVLLLNPPSLRSSLVLAHLGLCKLDAVAFHSVRYHFTQAKRWKGLFCLEFSIFGSAEELVGRPN